MSGITSRKQREIGIGKAICPVKYLRILQQLEEIAWVALDFAFEQFRPVRSTAT